MGLLGILVALGLLIWLAFRGWSVLLLAPAGGDPGAALCGGEPLLANWTQTFMGSAARFLTQFFPIFLLGALFGKLMEDSGSVTAIAGFMTERSARGRAVLAVVLAGAAGHLWRRQSCSSHSSCWRRWRMRCFARRRSRGRLMPAAIVLGTSTFTMSALPGTPVDPERDPDAVLRHHAVRRARASASSPRSIMLGFGLWWLDRAEAAARRKGEGYRR